MSFDLGVFYTEKTQSDDDAGERYAAYCDADDLAPWIEPSSKVAAFLKELTKQYPDIDEFPEQSVDDSPWAAALDVSGGYILMPMVFSWAERMHPIIVGLAAKHGLVCFDPQQGKVVTAPPGIHVEDADEPPVAVPENRENPAKPLAGALKDMLKPLGFEHKGRYWRKDADKAVIALEAFNNGGLYEIWFYVWFKDFGDADPAKVKSGGKFHLCRELASDFVPERLKFRLIRAFNFTTDYADSIKRLYGDDEVGRKIASYYVPREPLTAAWRSATLRGALEQHVLPFFNRVEAGKHEAIFAEEKAERDKEHRDANEAALKELRESVAMCRRWIGASMDEGELIARARKGIGVTAFVALALSLAFGWTLAETQEKMAANGIQWTNMTKKMLDKQFEQQDSLLLHADGHTELLPE